MTTAVRSTATDAPPAAAPTPHAGARRGRRWTLRAFIIVMVLAGAVSSLSIAVSRFKGAGAPEAPAIFTVCRKSFPVMVEAKGELKAKKTTDIKSKVEGRATIIWVIDEGSQVQEGELLVQLASDQIEEKITQEEATEASAIAALEAAEKDLEILIDQNKSDIRKAELRVELAEIDRKKYLEGDAKKAFMDAELEIERAQQMLERTTLDSEAADRLYDQEYKTRSEWLQAKFNLEEAERNLEKALLGLEILKKYTHPRDFRQKDSDVEEAKKDLARVKKSALAKEAQKRADAEAKRAQLLNTQSKLKKYREQRDNCEIRAPAPGLVVYDTGRRYDPRKITEGSEVYERQTIVTLPDPSVMNVVVRIHEANTNKIEIGQQARVAVEGIPDAIFTGAVTRIAPLADSRNRWLNPDLKEYETEITLDEAGEDLKPGMTARVEILVSEVADTLCVPVQAVFGKGGRHYVFTPEGREVEPVEITVGESSTEYVEIVEGVEEGGDVMLAVSEDATRLLPDLPPVEPSVNGKPHSDETPKAAEATLESQGAAVPAGAVRQNRAEQGPS